MMNPEILRPEVVHQISDICTILAPAFLYGLAFSQKQKDWFKERDESKCQFPVEIHGEDYTACGRTDYLQIHHVSPQRFSRDVYHWPDEKIDSKENGITLCIGHHQDVVHPDMALAQANYRADKQSYNKAFKVRDALVKNQTVYWNAQYDNLFRRVVEIRNKLFAKPFPKR